MTNERNVQQYKEQMVNTMTQGELLLLLYDELVKRLTQAELALDKSLFPVYESSVQRSIEIVEYLSATLDPQYSISHELSQLYEYFVYELNRAKIGRRKERLVPIKDKIMELRDAFRIAQKNSDSAK